MMQNKFMHPGKEREEMDVPLRCSRSLSLTVLCFDGRKSLQVAFPSPRLWMEFSEICTKSSFPKAWTIVCLSTRKGKRSANLDFLAAETDVQKGVGHNFTDRPIGARGAQMSIYLTYQGNQSAGMEHHGAGSLNLHPWVTNQMVPIPLVSWSGWWSKYQSPRTFPRDSPSWDGTE